MRNESRPRPAAAASAARIPAPPRWWEGWGRRPPAEGGKREVWTPEARALQRLASPTRLPQSGLYPLMTVFQWVNQEIRRVDGETGQLAVVVLQLPALPAAPEHRQRQLEIALRREVRSNDLPTRLSETALAVALPETGADAAGVADRLQQVLSQVAGARVGGGAACYPRDGRTALELLRTAAQRSQAAPAGKWKDPELERLLGPLL